MWPYLVCVALTGCSGANYAVSMTNTNAFYPHRLKGFAVGFNAGAGNLGVPMIQLVGLLVIAVAGHRQPYGCAGCAEQSVGNCVVMHRNPPGIHS